MKKICAFIIVLSLSFAILGAATLEDIQKLASQGKYAEAISAADSILQQKPGNINVLRWIAYLNYKQGNFDNVIALDAQNLSDAEISNIVGLAYMAKNNYSEAEKAFNKAVVYDKKFPDAFINKAEIYIINKDFKNAKECLKTANYIDSNDFRTLYKLGYVNIQLGEYSNAVANYLKASAIDPKDESVFINLGYAYIYNKDYKNALNSFNKATEIRKDSPEANLGLAVTYASMKNYKEAEKYYSELLKTENNYNNNYNMDLF
ncbi:MAG: tetratricopeptide repeat protein [Armatimonadetes bacterium]|nr:tetratricopeptide repeat protein [Candidatus Hippobium faecium]